MYLSIKQHDSFRTLLSGFEVPYRSYIARIITEKYPNASSFDAMMRSKNGKLSPLSPSFLRETLPSACKKNNFTKMYNLFIEAANSTDEIITEDKDMPMVGALNLVTFALVDDFSELYSLFSSYSDFCSLAEKYRYARNKLFHPHCRTLEESHLVPVLSFVQDICNFLDNKFFHEKNKDQLSREITALQQRKVEIPIETHNLWEMPYGESRVVCRDNEIERIKRFIYGDPDDIRKPHSFCVYGYGGVGKTALVLEVAKQVAQDVTDNLAANDYSPDYILFFSAKKRKLTISQETGRIVEQKMRWHFETADELITQIHQLLDCTNFRKFHKEGFIIVDNLESLSDNDREIIKQFIDTGTPAEMQFIITSRHCEDYDINYKLDGFEFEAGSIFINKYSEENALGLVLSPRDADELLSLSRGNTLVLVLCLRRLSDKFSTITTLKSDFQSYNPWNRLRKSLKNIPQNAYETISEFMFQDTFEQIEGVFSEDISLFYQILKIFAVTQNEDIDINTVCLLTNTPYPRVEEAIDILRNYLILETKNGRYSLNAFAEKYIVGRFFPDAETYEKLLTAIVTRKRQIKDSLEQLEIDKKERPELAKILKDWKIITDSDRITAAKMYHLYSEVSTACNGSRFSMQTAMDNFYHTCNEAEQITAHPYIKYQKARILQKIDESNTLPQKHQNEILTAFNDAIFKIKTIDQYAAIQQTKSYASLLWLYGQYLRDSGDLLTAIRFLEDGQKSFEQNNHYSQQYYQCCTLLGHAYLDYYLEERNSRLAYLRRSRSICRFLFNNLDVLGKARSHAYNLKNRLTPYGQY